MAVVFRESSNFKKIRTEIEDYLYNSVYSIEMDHDRALRSVELFIEAIDRCFSTLETMYQIPSEKDLGEKSFPLKNGRYRIFYYVRTISPSDFEITLLDIDDNRQSNLDRFPSHLISFDDDSQ